MRIPHHLTIIGAAFGDTVGAIGMGLLGAVVFGGTINAIISAAMGASTGAILSGTIVGNNIDASANYSCYGSLGAIFGAICGSVVAMIIAGGSVLSVLSGATVGAISIGILGAFLDGLIPSASTIFQAIKDFVVIVFSGAVSIAFLFALAGAICGPNGGAADCPPLPPLFAEGRLGAIIRGTILGAIMGVALGAVMAVIIGTGGGVYLKQIKTDG